MRDCVARFVPQFFSFLSSCSEIRAMGILDFFLVIIDISDDGPIFYVPLPFFPCGMEGMTCRASSSTYLTFSSVQPCSVWDARYRSS